MNLNQQACRSCSACHRLESTNCVCVFCINSVPANLQAGRLWECAGQEPFAAAEAYVRVLHSQLSVPFWGAHVQHGWMAPLAGLLFAWASEIHGHQSSADSNQPSTSLLSQQEASFLGEVCKDPHAGVVGLFALPLLSLSVGYQPDMKVLEEGAAFVEASMDALGPWEIVVLLWGSARTGLKPSSKFLSKAEASLKNIDELSVRESAAALWALCMLGAITEKTWETLLSHIAAHRSGDFDEASILHILQASMMYASKRKAGTPTGDLRATKMEVETLLSSLHWKVLRWCLDAYYEFIPSHPYLDGPYMTLSFMMQMLNRFRASCGSSDPKQNAYDKYMGSITKREVDWAEKTLQDARKLSQLKRELFYQWRGNEIVDEWQEVVNEAIFLLTRRLGNVVLQPPDCDIALPQKGVAIFIEGVHIYVIS